jgi:ADP-ribose pyrophosphatase YjhB (NUDIX family)
LTILRVETGLMSPKQMDAAFLWLYCLDGRPYEKYLAAGAQRRMAMVLAMLRWDGRFGTAGGKVEPGESLRSALARESCEEADFWLSASDEPVQLGTAIDSDWHIHSFGLQVSYAELLEARTKATRVANQSPECAGWCVVPAGSYLPGDNGPRGVEAFRANHFASTAGIEFDALLAHIANELQAESSAEAS